MPLRAAGRSTGESKGQNSFQQLLVIAQLSLAVALTAGVGLLVRSFQQLSQVDPGFQPDGLLLAEMALPASRYAEWHQIDSFYKQLLSKIRQSPNIKSAAIAYDHPLESNWINDFYIERNTDSNLEPSGRLMIVSDGYFETSGIELVQGRSFREEDDEQHPGVVIINENWPAGISRQPIRSAIDCVFLHRDTCGAMQCRKFSRLSELQRM